MFNFLISFPFHKKSLHQDIVSRPKSFALKFYFFLKKHSKWKTAEQNENSRLRTEGHPSFFNIHKFNGHVFVFVRLLLDSMCALKLINYFCNCALCACCILIVYLSGLRTTNEHKIQYKKSDTDKSYERNLSAPHFWYPILCRCVFFPKPPANSLPFVVLLVYVFAHLLSGDSSNIFV